MDATTRQCDNCYTVLQGNFCHQCGQEKKHYIRHVGGVVTEFFGEFSNWDARVWRTLLPLWFRPSFLSRRYVAGHRVPYVPPLRLYLFTSIIAFILLAKLLPNNAVTLNEERTTLPSVVNGAPVNAEQFQQELMTQIKTDAKAEGMDLGFLSDDDNSTFGRKLNELSANPKLAINKFFSLAPQMLMVMLPVFALFLKLIYCRSGRFYTEHLIVALHSHSFILQFSVLYLALDLLAGKLTAFALQEGVNLLWLTTPINWLAQGVLFWIPLYLLLFQKYYYAQSWRKTLLKFWLVSSLYNMLAITALMGVIMLSILWA